MKQLFGLDYLNEIDVEAVNESFVKEVQQSAAALLHKRHRIQDGAPDDFQIFNQAEMLETASSFTRMFTILLGGIASISLLVGGIGIMNVMLVTVTERTREIGIRKAVGARDRDILKQFLVEAVLMTTLGGGTGVAIGAGASKALQALTQYSSVISSTSILLAISFSGAVGVFFGFYPAWRAAKLDPIEALRYE
jgi:putative ABC transport system permease protein